MLNIKHLSIRHKILAIASIGLICLVAYTIQIQWILRSNNNTLTEIYNSSSVIIEKLNVNKEIAATMGGYMNDAIMAEDIVHMESGIYQLSESKANLAELIKLDKDSHQRIQELYDLMTE